MYKDFYRAVTGIEKAVYVVFNGLSGVHRLRKRGMALSENIKAVAFGPTIVGGFITAIISAIALDVREPVAALEIVTYLGGGSLLWAVGALQIGTLYTVGQHDYRLAREGKREGADWSLR